MSKCGQTMAGIGDVLTGGGGSGAAPTNEASPAPTNEASSAPIDQVKPTNGSKGEKPTENAKI